MQDSESSDTTTTWKHSKPVLHHNYAAVKTSKKANKRRLGERYYWYLSYHGTESVRIAAFG